MDFYLHLWLYVQYPSLLYFIQGLCIAHNKCYSFLYVHQNIIIIIKDTSQI